MPTPDHKLIKVAILIPTFRRAESLEALLRCLDEAMPDLHEAGRWQIRVFVVDNDAQDHHGSDRVAQLSDELRIDVQASVEPARGVSAVRNRLVAEALHWQAVYVLMIDDDEWPGAGWITYMLECAESHSADIVSGPVRPDFQSEPPAWIVRHRLFDDEPLSTGSFPAVQRTGNTLFRSSLLNDDRCAPDERWFSENLGRFGGEDSHLVERLVKAGARHVWCEEAIAHERIPASRLQFGYLAARAYRTGNCGMLYRSMLMPGRFWGSVRLFKSLFLATRWLLMSYRWVDPDSRKLHRLDWHILRGRVNAHMGRFEPFY